MINHEGLSLYRRDCDAIYAALGNEFASVIDIAARAGLHFQRVQRLLNELQLSRGIERAYAERKGKVVTLWRLRPQSGQRLESERGRIPVGREMLKRIARNQGCG